MDGNFPNSGWTPIRLIAEEWQDIASTTFYSPSPTWESSTPGHRYGIPPQTFHYAGHMASGQQHTSPEVGNVSVPYRHGRIFDGGRLSG